MPPSASAVRADCSAAFAASREAFAADSVAVACCTAASREARATRSAATAVTADRAAAMALMSAVASTVPRLIPSEKSCSRATRAPLVGTPVHSRLTGRPRLPQLGL